MSFTSTQKSTIKTYIQNDPDSLGFAPLVTSGSDESVADVLNFYRDGTTPCPVNNIIGAAITVFRNDVEPKEIIQSIASTDFSAATQIQISKLEMLFLMEILDLTLANVRANLQGIFSGASTSTQNALTAVATRHGSALEKLLGITGVFITSDDISSILRG